MSSITDEAKQIIDSVTAQGPLVPAQYAAVLPPRAASLARVFGRKEIIDAAEKYQRADNRAVRAQWWFVLIGKTAAYSAFLAAVLGGILLHPASMISDPILLTLGAAQLVLLAVSLVCSLTLYAFKPFRAWRGERGQAEAQRLSIFSLMMFDTSSDPKVDTLFLPLKLECFRRHLLDDQISYFSRRAPQHRRVARWWFWLRVLALLFVLATSLPTLAKLQAFGWLPQGLQTLLPSLPLTGSGVRETYALLGLVGGALQGLLAALAVISLSDRNADKFEAMLARLNYYSDKRLTGIRAAAAEGDSVAVGEFARQVVGDLASEASEWVLLQEALSEMTVKLVAQQHRIGG